VRIEHFPICPFQGGRFEKLELQAQMADDPNVVTKSAILQSVTAEANGFYGVIVTVASTFLGGSLFFVEKFALADTGWTVLIMGFGWIALVASIGCVARVRYMNLRSARMALQDRYDEASIIDAHTDTLSNWSQRLLILGMLALVLTGVLNFKQITRHEGKEKMINQNSELKESLPYGSLRPAPQAPPQNVPAPPPPATEKK
jgi:hypothetical protein